MLINDVEQGLVVSEIEGTSAGGSKYKGKIMLIDDPSRVYLGTTTMKNKEGLRIRAMMSHYDAIAGINASGFADPGDAGHGGDVIGLSYSDGEFWGEAVSYYGSVLLTSDDKLVVGNVKDWKKYDIRAGIQFGPVLIADGEEAISGSGGYGIQPRTAIGQREDGVIVFLVIDGRQPTWSIGCTMGDLVDILLAYGVENAACCDGGSSSVLAYDGKVINKNSSANPDYGRRLPNAWLVAPKETDDAES
ncbi:MAG: phosphodiester glycosidase family protein [Ruminococcaceae bacterium]|nr:phosphodiester glycosidase family protein [Oscillospiraceae bacterium]